MYECVNLAGKGNDHWKVCGGGGGGGGKKIGPGQLVYLEVRLQKRSTRKPALPSAATAGKRILYLLAPPPLLTPAGGGVQTGADGREEKRMQLRGGLRVSGAKVGGVKEAPRRPTASERALEEGRG